LTNFHLNVLLTVVPLHIFHDRQLNRLVFSPSSAFGETAVYIPPWWDPENFEPGTEPITEKRYALAVSCPYTAIPLCIPIWATSLILEIPILQPVVRP